MRKLLSILGPCIGNLLPMLGFRRWNERKTDIARLAVPAECKGSEPISGSDDGNFTVMAVVQDRVVPYSVRGIALEFTERKKNPRTDVFFSGCEDARRHVFGRAHIVVRGSSSVFDALQQRIDALAPPKSEPERSHS